MVNIHLKTAREHPHVGIVDQQCTFKILAWLLLNAGHAVALIEQTVLNVLLVPQGLECQQKNSSKRTVKQGIVNTKSWSELIPRKRRLQQLRRTRTSRPRLNPQLIIPKPHQYYLPKSRQMMLCVYEGRPRQPLSFPEASKIYVDKRWERRHYA